MCVCVEDIHCLLYLFVACGQFVLICIFFFFLYDQQTMILPNFGRLAKLVILANL